MAARGGGREAMRPASQRDEYQGARYSLAFFAQANRDVVIAGPAAKYAPITADDYLQQRIAANFAKY